MTRFLVFVFALTVAGAIAACRPAPTDLSPDALRTSYRSALLNGDRDRALDLLDAGAEAGHLFALAKLADAHAKGYLSVPWDAERKAPGVLPIRSLPGQAALAQRRYERALERGARNGEPQALLAIALDLVGPLYVTDGEMSSRIAPADRDSAEALYRRLVETDVLRMPLAHVAQALGDERGHVRLLAEAAEAGEPNACFSLIWFGGDRPDLSSMRGRAEYIDRMIACAPEGEGFEEAATSVRTLASELDRGNEAAGAALDSLRQLGVFERHPRLTAIAAAP